MSIQPIFLALLILLTTGVSSAQDGKSTPLKGLTSWQGTLDVGAAKLRLKFEIQSQDDTLNLCNQISTINHLPGPLQLKEKGQNRINQYEHY